MEEKIKKVLLVEDDLAIADIYKTVMEKDGFKVEVVSLGEEAIKKIKDLETNKDAKPDIILLDLILPDINGIEVLQEIKKTNITKDIAVFILTNQENSQFSNGMKPDKFIIKANITPTQLLGLIKEELK